MVAIIVVWAILGLRLATNKKELAQLNEQLKSLNFSMQKLNKLKEEQKQSQSELEFLKQHLVREVLWARNLNRLSNLIPLGIWLKKLVLHTRKNGDEDKYQKLDIVAAAISLQGQEMIDLIGSFMSALKKDEFFSGQFSEIKLVSSQRSKIEKLEVMNFQLLCQFR